MTVRAWSRQIAAAAATWLALAGPAAAGPAHTQPNLTPGPGWPPPVMDRMTNAMVFFELLEYRPDRQGLVWDAVGWVGGDYQRLWVKSEGLAHAALGGGDVDLQVLYGWLVTPFFDLQAGVRLDREWDATGQKGRVHGVLGLQGLAPFVFELEPALFVDQAGHVAVRVTASRDLYLTQRTLLQARAEADAAVQAVPGFEVGAGFNHLELGLRVRHQLWREVAPYVGVTWEGAFGETAALSTAAGRPTSGLAGVAGVSLWY